MVRRAGKPYAMNVAKLRNKESRSKQRPNSVRSATAPCPALSEPTALKLLPDLVRAVLTFPSPEEMAEQVHQQGAGFSSREGRQMVDWFQRFAERLDECSRSSSSQEAELPTSMHEAEADELR